MALPALIRGPRPGRLRWPQMLLLLLLLLVLPTLAPGLAAAQTAEPHYRFRQAPRAGLILPSVDLLSPRERAFLAELPVLRVGLNLPDNRPYEVIAADGEISGIQIEILTHLAQALGLRLQPVVLASFSDALAALREQRVDMMATVGFEASREAYLAYTLGTAPNPGAIIGRAMDNRFVGEPSLNGRRVAVERDYVTQYYVRRLYPDVYVNDQPDTAAALRAVALGEDDYYFGSLLMAMDRLQRDTITGLAVKKSLIYGTGQMHFGVRKDWPLLASALSKGVAALRQSPMPSLQAALQSLGAHKDSITLALPLSQQEQRQLVGRSVLRVGAVRGLALLNEATPGGGHAGIAADYTAQVATRLGTAVDVLPFDSVAQLLDALRDGRIHIAPLLTRTPEREKVFAYSDPYLEMPYHVIARSDSLLLWDLASLHGKRLALAAQHPLREFLASRYPAIQIVDAPPGPGAMDMVVSRQADAAVEAKLYANLRINQDNDGVLRQAAKVDEIPAQFHFAASRAAAELIPLINRALADIAPAEHERLYRRWVAVDIRPGFAWRRFAPLLLAAGATLLLLAAASIWWMRRLAREVRSRSAAEQRLRDVTNSLPGVVFQSVRDAAGQVQQVYRSDAVAAFLGPGLQPGVDLADLVLQRMPPEQASSLRSAWATSLHTGQAFKQTFQYLAPGEAQQTGAARNGAAASPPAPRWLHCEITARPAAPGLTAWTGYLIDVSGERALQAQLLDAVQAKNLFVASASHELRAPLQTIGLALHRLGAGPLDAVQRQCWQVAQAASHTLVQLIDDVLDLSRFEAGEVRLQTAPLALAPLLGQIVEQHRLAADARGLQLALQLAPGLPEQVQLDALRLRQLLANLIGNALKFTVQGGVTVLARLQPDGLALTVQDTGVGIAAEQQHRLFEPFGALQRGAPALTALAAAADGTERSTGLGLAICKRLVQAMHGSIQLHSSPGVGTQVQVLLPLPPLQAGLAHETAWPQGTARHGTVLLVDDDPVSRQLMAEMLLHAGYVVLQADDALAALACWRTQALAAVISDRHMPGMDGPTLLRQIGAEASASGRPCPRRLLCTGDTELTDAGDADRVLAKPVSLALLRSALDTLGVLPAPGPAAGPASAATSAATSDPAADPAADTAADPAADTAANPAADPAAYPAKPVADNPAHGAWRV